MASAAVPADPQSVYPSLPSLHPITVPRISSSSTKKTLACVILIPSADWILNGIIILQMYIILLIRYLLSKSWSIPPMGKCE
jgi:hypothetical protein